MRFFVTGASGFVGSHLVPRLLRHGPVATLQRPDGPGPAPSGCTAIAGDITQPSDLAKAPAMDVIVHLAAEASPQRAAQEPQRTRHVNVDGTANVLDLARRHGARLVFLSTGQVYGPSLGHPFKETDPIHPQGAYPQSKADAERLVAQAANDGLSASSLRCFNMYGPGQVGPYVVPDIMAALRDGRTPHLRDLAPARDFLFIGDAVAAIEAVALRRDAPAIVNVASGRTHTIGDVARTACDLAGVPPPTGPSMNADIVEADVTRLRALGWTPQTSLRDGLAQTLAWWQARPKP